MIWRQPRVDRDGGPCAAFAYDLAGSWEKRTQHRHSCHAKIVVETNASADYQRIVCSVHGILQSKQEDEKGTEQRLQTDHFRLLLNFSPSSSSSSSRVILSLVGAAR